MVADLSRRKLFALGAAAAVAPVVAPLAAFSGVMTIAEYERRIGRPAMEKIADDLVRGDETVGPLRFDLLYGFKAVR